MLYTVKRRADKISKECILVEMFKRSKGMTCVCPLGSGLGSWIDLVQLIGLWSLILKSETSLVVMTVTALGFFRKCDLLMR